MGYDLWWHDAAAELDAHEPKHITGDDDLRAWDEIWTRHHPTAHFGANAGGMRQLCDAMEALGMVYPSEPGAWPDDEALFGDHLRLAGVQERPGIPRHKLGSTNDHWHVTPLEIQGAFAQLQRARRTSEPLPDWWVEWLEWLGDAIEHGGLVNG